MLQTRLMDINPLSGSTLPLTSNFVEKLTGILPMANVAKEIIRENGFEDFINVIPKSSLDLSIPKG